MLRMGARQKRCLHRVPELGPMHVYMHVMCRPTWCNVVSTFETESIDHWIGTVCALVRSPFDVVRPPRTLAVLGPDGDDDAFPDRRRVAVRT